MIEPVEWMAASGLITREELAVIEAKATEALARIDAPAENVGSGGVDRADRRALKLHQTVQRALRTG